MKTMFRTICVLLAAGLAAGEAPGTAVTIDLGGTDWMLTNGSMPSISATVPGQTHTDLLQAGIIDEPFNASNSDLQRWVALANWTYSRKFSVPSGFLSHRTVQLVSLGIDTVATISINGHRVYYTDNMFHRIRLNIKPYLVDGDNNTIQVYFTSKVVEASARWSACDNETSIICPSRIGNPVQHGFDNQNYLRTEPCSFSWDWGPGFAPMGLWRPIFIQAYDSAVVRDITVVTTPARASAELVATRMADPSYFEPADQFAASDNSTEAVIARAFRRTDREIDESKWNAKVTVYLDTGVDDAGNSGTQGAASISGTVVVSLAGRPSVSQRVSLPVGKDSSASISLSNIDNISPWMPNGFGTQQLYVVSASFVPQGQEAALASMQNGFEVPYLLQDNAIKGSNGTYSVRTGFRTVDLVQDPLPGGKSYYFKVTGVPIPVKGSNWIPADAFESRVSRNDQFTTRLEPLFWGLKDSYQNMIRNWGGGIYQRDSFYDLADEYGVLIWEDLMFACAQYAAPPEFLQSAAKEIVDNVKRLQSHPSIALWAGNNEDEKDMEKFPTGGVDPAHIEAYSALTFITGLGNVSEIDLSRPLSGSSPSDGNETAAHPFSWDHQSQFYGDVHCYLYDVDNWDVTAYKRPRFMSEFGLQSWPSAITMKTVFPPEEWSFSSDFSINRNHHPNGNSQIEQQISMHFHLPDDCWPQCTGDKKDYSNWAYMLYLTQLNQALGYKAEVEHFRRIRTDCSESVAGCNMGRMYWQTNDIWQGASWAAMDYTSRYKMVQYFTKRFYEPFLVSAWGTAVHNDFGVSIINDHVHSSFNGTIEFIMHAWSGGVLGTWSEPFTSKPGTAKFVYNNSDTFTFQDMLAKGNCHDATECLLTMRALDESGAELSSNYLLLTPFYDVTTMQYPMLKVLDVKRGAAGSAGARPGEVPFNVSISTGTSAPVAFLWIETPFIGRWSDNALVTVDPNVTLTFYSDVLVNGADVSETDLAQSLATAGVWGGVTVLEPGKGGLWSLADTSVEYTSNA